MGAFVDGAALVRGSRRMVMASRKDLVVGVLERVGKEALGASLRTGGVARSARVHLSPEEGLVWREVSAELGRKGYGAEVVVWYRSSGVPSMVRVSWGAMGGVGEEGKEGEGKRFNHEGHEGTRREEGEEGEEKSSPQRHGGTEGEEGAEEGYALGRWLVRVKYWLLARLR